MVGSPQPTAPTWHGTPVRQTNRQRDEPRPISSQPLVCQHIVRSAEVCVNRGALAIHPTAPVSITGPCDSSLCVQRLRGLPQVLSGIGENRRGSGPGMICTRRSADWPPPVSRDTAGPFPPIRASGKGRCSGDARRPVNTPVHQEAPCDLGTPPGEACRSRLCGRTGIA